MSTAAKGDGALAKMEATLDRQLEPIRGELAAVRAEIGELRELIAGPSHRTLARRLSRRGRHSPAEAQRIVAWLEGHRSDWAHLPYEGTLRGWINRRSKPSRRKVLQLFLGPLDPPTDDDGESKIEPGLGWTEPELEALLAGEDEIDGDRKPAASDESEEGTSR